MHRPTWRTTQVFKASGTKLVAKAQEDNSDMKSPFVLTELYQG